MDLEKNDYVGKIKVVKNLTRHIDCVNCVLLVENYNRFLSASSDNSMIIWDSNFKYMGKYRSTKACDFNQLILWEENVVLLLSNDEVVALALTETEPYFKVVKMISDIEFLKKFTFHKMLKLNHEDLMMIVASSELFVISYSKCTIFRKISHDGVHFYTFPRSSKKYPNTFYINFMDNNHSIVRLNYTSGIQERYYSDHKMYINYMICYQNMAGDEVVAAGGDNRFIYLYTTKEPYLRYRDFKKVKTENQIYSISFLVSNHQEYLFVGSEYGVLNLISCISPPKSIYEKRIEMMKKRIYDIKLISTSKNTVRISVCGDDSNILILELQNLRFDPINDQEIIDQNERTQYLLENTENFFYDYAEKDYQFKIQINSSSIISPFRIFMLN